MSNVTLLKNVNIKNRNERANSTLAYSYKNAGVKVPICSPQNAFKPFDRDNSKIFQ
jgi:hypothetical protein